MLAVEPVGVSQHSYMYVWCSLYLCGRGPRARVKDLDLGAKLMVGFLESNGQALLAQQIVCQHKQQHEPPVFLMMRKENNCPPLWIRTRFVHSSLSTNFGMAFRVATKFTIFSFMKVKNKHTARRWISTRKTTSSSSEVDDDVHRVSLLKLGWNELLVVGDSS